MASCETCPSFLDRHDLAGQEQVYGRALTVPACPRKGKLLGSNRMSAIEESSLQQDTGDSCPDHGKTKASSTKVLINLNIGIGMPPEAADSGLDVKTCRSCHFYVPAGIVSGEIGVALGLCSKFANLLPDSKLTETAQRCRSGVRLSLPQGQTPMQHQAELLNSIVLDPILGRYIGDFVTELGNREVTSPEFTESYDPETHASDRPVSAAAAAQGIRAWRKLSRKGKHVYLPVFDANFFNENERAKIPKTGDDEHPEQYVDHQGIAFTTAVLWRELDETPALHGVAGTGKTEFFRYMAWMMSLPFERISITRSTELDDLAGKTHFENEETVFKKGRIPQAWAKPCIVVLDEPNVGPPDVWQFIRPLTDNSKQLVLDMNEGEVVKRNDHAYLGLAMNPAWDMRNIGAEQLSDADGSRLMHISVGLPGEKIESKIIRDRCLLDGYEIPDELLGKIMAIAKELRLMADDQTLPITWGIRPQIKVARATRWFDMREAYRLAAADYLEPAVQDTILDTVKNHSR